MDKRRVPAATAFLTGIRKSNHMSALQNSEFVNNAIGDLTNNRYVSEVEKGHTLVAPYQWLQITQAKND